MRTQQRFFKKLSVGGKGRNIRDWLTSMPNPGGGNNNGGGDPNKYVFITNRGYTPRANGYPEAPYFSDGTELGRTYKFPFYVTSSATSFKVVYSNFSPNGNASGYPDSYYDVDGPNPYTIKAGYEYGTSGTTATKITFNGGQDTAVVAPGTFVESDPIDINLLEGQTLWIRSYVSVETLGMKWPMGQEFNNVSGGANDGQASGDVAWGDTGSTNWVNKIAAGMVNNNSQTFIGFTPTCIIGKRVDPTAPAVLIVGDSISRSGADSKTSNGQLQPISDPYLTSTDLGYLNRALWKKVAYCNTGLAGDQAAKRAIAQNARHRDYLAKYATHVICELGINDMYSTTATGGINDVNAYENIKIVWKRYKDMGLKVAQCTITPFATSTDGFKTIENQTSAGGNNNAYTRAMALADRQHYNQLIKDSLSQGLIDGVFDAGGAIGYNNVAVFKVIPAPMSGGDNLHPGVNGSVYAAKAIDIPWLKGQRATVQGAETPLGPVTGVTVVSGDGRVALSWDKPVENRFGYFRIYRDSGDGNYVKIADAIYPHVQYYLDTTVVNGMTYDYVVRAVDIWDQEGAAHNPVVARPAVGGVVMYNTFTGTDYTTPGASDSVGPSSETLTPIVPLSATNWIIWQGVLTKKTATNNTSDDFVVDPSIGTDFDISFDITYAGNGTNVQFRQLTTPANSYQSVSLFQGSTFPILYGKYSNANISQVNGTRTGAWVVGQKYRFRIIAVGPQIRVYVDGVEVLNGADSNYQYIANALTKVTINDSAGSITAQARNKAYAVNALVIPSTPNGYYYKCTTAGTSDATTEPVWPTTQDATVTDGTAVWTCKAFSRFDNYTIKKF